MRANYEQLVKAHQRAPQVQEDLVPDEVKFQVIFKQFYMCNSILNGSAHKSRELDIFLETIFRRTKVQLLCTAV